jgi:hypothetical protein
MHDDASRLSRRVSPWQPKTSHKLNASSVTSVPRYLSPSHTAKVVQDRFHFRVLKWAALPLRTRESHVDHHWMHPQPSLSVHSTLYTLLAFFFIT